MLFLQPFLAGIISAQMPQGVWHMIVLAVAAGYAGAAFALTTHRRQPDNARDNTDPTEQRTLRRLARVGAVAVPLGVLVSTFASNAQSGALATASVLLFFAGVLGLIPLNAWLAALADWTPSQRIANQLRGAAFCIAAGGVIGLLALVFYDELGILGAFEVTSIFTLTHGFVLAAAAIIISLSVGWTFILALLMVSELGWARINAKQRDERDQRIEARRNAHWAAQPKPPSVEEYAAPAPVDFADPDHVPPEREGSLQLPGDPTPAIAERPADDAPIPLEADPVEGAPDKPIQPANRPAPTPRPRPSNPTG